MPTQQPSEIQLQVLGGGDDIKELPAAAGNQTRAAKRNYWWWTKVAIYTVLVLLGQSVGLLLGRLYFVKGGTSKWISSVVQVAGFPVLIPYYLLVLPKLQRDQGSSKSPAVGTAAPSPFTLVSIYCGLGLILGFSTFLYSVGLQYLPVSTYTLLCSSQLAFNSFFAYFLNSQKFTPYVVNSLILLTISSLLLVFNTSDDNSGGPTISKIKYTTGFICTLAASAIYGLILSLTEFTFTRVIKRRSFQNVMDMNICLNFAATSVTLVGLFASGEWKGLGAEMTGYGPGKASYVMTLVGIAVFWQLFYIGVVGLIFEVSSLFSNSISVVGAPIVPIMAVVIFHDKMSGVKGVSMALAIWGFVSYIYPYYVDERESKKAAEDAGNSSPALVDDQN